MILKRLTLLQLLFILFVSASSRAQTAGNQKNQGDEKALRETIRKIESTPDAPLGDEFTHVSRNIDLNGDGRDEVIVWIPEGDIGGTSGYPILILARTKTGFRRLLDRNQGWTPIIVLNSKKGQWRDVAFLEAGGGAKPTYLIYANDGKTYRYARRQISQPRGDIIIKKDWNQTTFGPIPKQ